MKLLLNLDFGLPIWRVYFVPKLVNSIPYKFKYKNKEYINGITIINFGFFINEDTFIYHPGFCDNLKCPNPILCVPNKHIYDIFKKYRPQYEVILVNQNAFINENVWKIINKQKKYDMVINSSFTKLKNLQLTKLIENKVYIGYKNGSLEEFNECVPKDGYIPNFEDRERNIDNWIRMEESDIIGFLNESYVGGIFSNAEGCCFSSSEYLLCGLPVISVKCEGGREYWYNKENSIICKNDPLEIKNAVELAKKKLKNGEFNPIKIRNKHIEMQNKHRKYLTDKVIEVYNKIGKSKIEYKKLYDYLKYYQTRELKEFEKKYKEQAIEVFTSFGINSEFMFI